MPKRKEWFGEWFDSPYYHILYKHRDHEEARAFIDRVADHLSFHPDHKILDLACGKGRHAIYLNEKGFDIVGLDLSEQSIAFARQFANEHLHFYVHDMRNSFVHEGFDYILNLFTSFGYFETKEEHLMAIKSMSKALKPDGTLLLDFLNPYTVIHHLIPEEIKIIDGIEFHITKDVDADGYILKCINFDHLGKSYNFKEKVKALRRADFLDFFNKAGLEVINTFGDYRLSTYVAEESDRMIFEVRKLKFQS